MTPRRIALYTHSTNPRGGVVHTLELGDALTRAGHDVTIFAPDPTGSGFFRRTTARQVSIPAAPAPASLAAMMVQRIAEISNYIRAVGKNYEVHHAQDSVNANALLACTKTRDINSFLRTVHHVDSYTDPLLRDWQHRGIRGASKCFCVSKTWQEFLAAEYGLHAEIVPNGVSMKRFSSDPSPHDAALRKKFGIGQGPIFLAVGGIEGRKNTINILHAFTLFAKSEPQAQLIIAGGASLLDHSAYLSTFHTHLAATSIVDRIILTGPLPDEDMPSLYRMADALVFPSVKEGFGLVVLEALATGTPVIVSRIAPFTEYLTDADCHFADPYDPQTIAAAMQDSLTPQARGRAVNARSKIASRMNWDASAVRHTALYGKFCQEPANA